MLDFGLYEAVSWVNRDAYCVTWDKCLYFREWQEVRLTCAFWWLADYYGFLRILMLICRALLIHFGSLFGVTFLPFWLFKKDTDRANFPSFVLLTMNCNTSELCYSVSILLGASLKTPWPNSSALASKQTSYFLKVWSGVILFQKLSS